VGKQYSGVRAENLDLRQVRDKTTKKRACKYRTTRLLIMAAQAGIEPVLGLLQACVAAAASEIAGNPDAQLRAQKLGELQEILAAWPKLSSELRTAVLAVTRSAN
jgi:hypothetical protein